MIENDSVNFIMRRDCESESEYNMVFTRVNINCELSCPIHHRNPIGNLMENGKIIGNFNLILFYL